MDTTVSKIIVKTVTFSSFLGLVLGACSNTFVAQHSTLQAAGVSESEANTEIVVADSKSVVVNSIDTTFAKAAPERSLREESDLLFNIITAEIAGRRGLVDVAAENYYDASVASDDPRVSERAVKLALYGRDWQRAELASSRWVELAPENVEAWQHRAQALIHLEDVEMATAAIDRVVELSGGEPGAVIPSVVDSILRQSDTRVGAKLLESLAGRYPENADTQYGIGRLALSKGDREMAMQAFDRALAIDPDNVETLLARARMQLSVGQGDDALIPLTDYLSRSPDDLSAQLGYARLLIENGKVERAADQLEIIYTKFSGDADALYTAGLLALDIQRISRAEKYLESVVTLDKHQDDASYYLGRISDSRTDFQEAIERYRNVDGGDNFFPAQIRAAELYGTVGLIDEGRSLFEELRTFTDERSIKIELFNSESRMLNANDQYEESLQLLTDGIEQYEDAPILLYSRALVAERLDQRQVFETDLLQVIQLQPENSYALNALGYFLVDRNERLDQAEEYLVKAYELNPEDAAITDSLGWLYYRQGRYADSLRLLKRAYAALPDTEIAAHLGEVLWVSGDQSQATKVWEEALRVAPDDDLLNSVMKKYIR